MNKPQKSGMMRLGAQSSNEAATDNPFPYVLFWGRLGRKGQRCRILKPGPVLLVEFEDGAQHTVNRMAVRRVRW